MTEASAHDIASLDASYVPFADFVAWKACEVSEEVWQEYLAALQARRASVDGAAREEAVRVALRAAAFDTGALEGLYDTTRGVTLTIATMAAAWEVELAQRGPETERHFAAQLDAYELVLDAATGSTPLSQAWLRRVHEVTTASQDTYRVMTEVGPQDQTLSRGTYKTRPNHVRQADGSLHAYAPVDRTEGEMQRLVEQLRGEDFEQAHPVLQAAYAHHALAAVHPFADGNGRVARALASVFLYRAIGVPLVVFVEQRASYLSVLAQADAGLYQPFVDFTFEAALDSTGLVTDTLRRAASPSLQERADHLAAAVESSADAERAELRAASLRLVEQVEQKLGELTESLTLPANCSVRVSRSTGAELNRAPYVPRHDDQGRPEVIRLSLTAGSAGSAMRRFYAGLSFLRGDDLPLALYSDSGGQLRFRLSDVQPSPRPATQRRIEGWLEEEVGAALDELGRLVQRGHS